MKLKGCFLSTRADWRTPKKLLKQLTKEFGPLFDPCPSQPTEDGLKISWKSPAFINPPYGRQIGKWIKKGFQEYRKGKTVIMLLPSRTDTKWFHTYVLKAKEIRFIKGRLRFDDKKGPAPFPSLIAVFQK